MNDLIAISARVRESDWQQFKELAEASRQTGEPHKNANWHLREAMRLYLQVLKMDLRHIGAQQDESPD